MRDPARIDRVLDLLRRYWTKYPDLRLAQIVVNATEHAAPDVFYTEDDRIEHYLRVCLDQIAKEAHAELVPAGVDVDAFLSRVRATMPNFAAAREATEDGLLADLDEIETLIAIERRVPREEIRAVLFRQLQDKTLTETALVARWIATISVLKSRIKDDP